MGMNLYIALKSDIGDLNPNDRDHVWTAEMIDQLDTIAASRGFKPLTSFFSYDEADLDEELVSGESMPSVSWFEADEVAQVTDRLCEAIEADARPFQETPLRGRVAELISEMRHVQEVAQRAVAAQTQVRLWIGE